MGLTELLQIVALALLAVGAGVSVVIQQALNAESAREPRFGIMGGIEQLSRGLADPRGSFARDA
jgi:hypothetical protein